MPNAPFNFEDINPFGAPQQVEPVEEDETPEFILFSKQPKKQEPIQPKKQEVVQPIKTANVLSEKEQQMMRIDEQLSLMIDEGKIDDIPKLKEAFDRMGLPYETILSDKLKKTGESALNSDGICDSANAILIGGQELSL